VDPITLQDLINAAQGEDGKPPADPAKAVAEYLAAHPDSDIAALQTEAITTYQEIAAAGADSDESLAAAEALADVLDGVKVEQERIDAAGEEKRARLAALSDRVKAATGSEAEGEDNADADATVDADTDADADNSADAGAVDAGEGGGDVDAGASAETAAPEAVAASAAKPVKRVRLSQIPRKTVKMPAENTPDAPRATIIASADVAGFGQGQNLTTSDLARAANVKLQGFPAGFVPNQEHTVPVASISIPFEEQLTADGKNDQEVIDYAADTSRLKGGSLVAGGWCAPSETLYELGGILADASAGLVDLPEAQAKRGGLRFTEGPDYAAIYGDPTFGFIQTEPQSVAGTGFTTATGGTVAGTEKPFYRVPCPEFTDVRAEAVGLGVVAGILANDAYPEVTQEVVEHGLIAHAHRINTRTLNRMQTLSGAPITLSLGPSATTSVLNAVDIQITDYRYANRMADNAELEVPIPLWAKPVFRADMSVRNGSNVTEALEVTDQKIEAWFRARNARVQWVYDWQDAFSGKVGGFGSVAPITAWPETIDIMIYKAGTFVRARGEIINVSAMYDTVNLKKNDYHVIFIEEKLLVIKRRWKSRLVRVPLAVNGTVGAAQVLDAQGKIAPVTP